MVPSAERHSGVDGDDHVILSRLIRPPCRHYNRPRPDPEHVEVLLPRILPLLLLDHTDAKLRDVPDVGDEPHRRVYTGVPSLQPIVVRNIGRNGHPLRDRRLLALVGIVSRRKLDSHAALTVLGEDLCQRLHELRRRVYA